MILLHCQASKRPSVQVNLARKSTDNVTAQEPRDDMDVDDPPELSSQHCAASTSELTDEAPELSGQHGAAATSELGEYQELSGRRPTSTSELEKSELSEE
jgi:hypothetical protein